MKLKQTEKILIHMLTIGPITPMDAIKEYGIMRLASRISDLKKAGVPIHKEMVKGKNRFEETVCYAQYSIEGREGTSCES